MYDATLRKNCLGFVELLAQGIALISPTMTAALIIPVMYGNSGDWSWLSYALGTVMLVFVAFNLNQFARRSTTAGSMYLYICRGLGITAGAIGGWSLIWAYLGISMAGVTGFSIFGDKLLEMAGIHVPFTVLFGACVAAAWFCAWKNVQLSAMLMLFLEGASMLLIVILCLVTLAQHGFKIDHAQFETSSLPLSGLGLGVVVAIFSLVGFECCTAFGEEARDPLVTIPKAVIWSLAISGGFFVFVSYVMVMATHGSDPALDKMDAPLNTMAFSCPPFDTESTSVAGSDGEFLRSLSLLHQRGKPGAVRHGSSRTLPRVDGRFPRNQRHATRRRNDPRGDRIRHSDGGRRGRRARAARSVQLRLERLRRLASSFPTS